MRRLLFLTPILLFIIIGTFLWRGLYGDPSIIPSVLIDKPAPGFDLPPAFPGIRGISSADIAGKVVLINFFASWCIPCHAEHPFLADVAKTGSLVIIGVDYKDRPDELRAWLDRDGNPYQAIGSDSEGRAGIDFGVSGVPESYLIDKQGRIRYKQIGPFDGNMLAQTLLPLAQELAKK
jgi:DsbE subfamily thiol:disulfide oxidoreductase